ncbi:MAG TPA: carboxypeptidase-like regulatory domain-containing protein [Thermoanaerobaculia bacterium]|nr:carboxypeptidase-like regulatory domain-containing protein [Thermoanaerobaculia bacterium]
MKRIIILITLILTIAATASASTVRGKVVKPDGATAYRGAAVTLEHAERGRSTPAYADNDGMFYLRNVPPGDYTMEVQTANDKAVFRITVLNQEYSDVAPVKVK